MVFDVVSSVIQFHFVTKYHLTILTLLRKKIQLLGNVRVHSEIQVPNKLVVVVVVKVFA